MSKIQEYFPLEAMAAKFIIFLLKISSLKFLNHATTEVNSLLLTQATALPVPLCMGVENE